jgi:hypothetical protein
MIWGQVLVHDRGCHGRRRVWRTDRLIRRQRSGHRPHFREGSDDRAHLHVLVEPAARSESGFQPHEPERDRLGLWNHLGPRTFRHSRHERSRPAPERLQASTSIRTPSTGIQTWMPMFRTDQSYTHNSNLTWTKGAHELRFGSTAIPLRSPARVLIESLILCIWLKVNDNGQTGP